MGTDGEACTIADAACIFYPSSSLSPDTTASTCASETGTASAHCPTANLVGCCASADETDCYYIGDAATYQSQCSDNSGTWTTTAP